MIQPPLLFSGTSNRQLAEEIAKRMQTRVGNALVDRFKNDECRIEIRENVRGAEVFVVQSLCRSPQGATVNDSLMELLLIIDALRRASANRITAVIPYFGYAKQDKKTKGREPISAKLVANMIERAGAERIVTLDLHAAQIQGFFDVPVDNLMAAPTLCNYLKNQDLQGDKVVVVSPDAGGVPRAETFAKRLKSIARRHHQAPPRARRLRGHAHRRRRRGEDRGRGRRHDLHRRHARQGGRGAAQARRDRSLYARDARHLRRRRDRAVREAPRSTRSS